MVCGSVLAFAPVVGLMRWGGQWRERMGEPVDFGVEGRDRQGEIEVDKLDEERKVDDV